MFTNSLDEEMVVLFVVDKQLKSRCLIVKNFYLLLA